MNKEHLMAMIKLYIAKGDLESLKKARVYIDKVIREGEREDRKGE